MAIRVRIDADVPLPPATARKTRIEPLPQRLKAYANTARLLVTEGAELEPTGTDEREAAAIVAKFAADPEEAAKTVTDKQLSTLSSAALIQADNILTEFGKQVVHNSNMLRHTVTNKLLLETEHPDARVRLKALELLGKISDVGLFAEKTEITVTHQTSDELRDALRMKLEQLRQPQIDRARKAEVITDADFEEVFGDDPDAPETDTISASDSNYDDDDETDAQDLSSVISSFDDDDYDD